MATLTVYPSPGSVSPCDGQVQHYNITTDWNTSHDASAGDSANTSNTSAVFSYLRTDVSGTRIGLVRYFFNFDTSALGVSATINSASIYFYAESKLDNSSVVSSEVGLVQTTPAGTNTLITDDYDQCGAIDNPPEGASRADPFNNWTITQYNEWVLNATGLAWISKTNITKLGVRQVNDLTDVYPGAGLRTNYTNISNADVAGTSQDPKLVIDYTPPGITIDLIESMTITDQSITFSLTKILSEVVLFADSIVVALSKIFNEIVSFVDYISSTKILLLIKLEVLNFIDTILVKGRWTKRIKPTSIWTDRLKPTTNWIKRIKP